MISRRHLQRHRALDRSLDRRAFSIIELVVSAVLLTTLLAMMGPMVKWVGTAETMSNERLIVVEHLANVMEEVASLVPGQRTKAVITPLLSAGLDELSLHDAEPLVVVEPTNDPAGQRVQLSVSWESDGTRKSSPVKLTAWFYGRAKS